MALTFWTLCILLIAVAHSTDVKDRPKGKDFDNLLSQIQAENALLKEQVRLLKERDIESDIEEIKQRLDSYGKDITSLRITQSEHRGELNQHSDHLAGIDETLVTYAGQLGAHDQTFVEHLQLIQENSNNIGSHNQVLNDHQVLIQGNTDGINNNVAKIQENLNGIIKNGQDILSLSDNYNNYRNSQVKFHVETSCCEGSDYWPDYSRLYYRVEHFDTHNALDPGTGQFTAPLSGWYEFILTADFRIYDERAEFAYISVNINENSVRKFLFDSHHDDEIYQSYSIYFSNYLNQGDRMDISVEGDPVLDIGRHGANWMGFMV
jgi:hypothetical protein